MVVNNGARTLPDVVHLAAGDAGRIPSPGTQRALKAQTGRAWDDLCGPTADSADRFQTLIWVRLRRQFPDLEWGECEDVELIIDDAGAAADPRGGSGSTTSPSSAGSGA